MAATDAGTKAGTEGISTADLGSTGGVCGSILPQQLLVGLCAPCHGARRSSNAIRVALTSCELRVPKKERLCFRPLLSVRLALGCRRRECFGEGAQQGFAQG